MLVLYGCASQPPEPEATAEAIPEPPEEVIVYKPFTADTFYALLVAELAGSRERYDIALNNYLQQADETRDLGVTKRAALIASYLNQRSAALMAAKLWSDLDPDDQKARHLLTEELVYSKQLVLALEQSLILLKNGESTLFRKIATAATGRKDLQKTLLQLMTSEADKGHENADLLTGMAILSQQQGDLDQAISYIDRAVELDPKNITADVIYSRMLTSRGDPDAAGVRLRELVESHPDNKPLRMEYARFLTKNDISAARVVFEELIRDYPEDPELVMSLGLIYFDLGELEQSEAQLKVAADYPNVSGTAEFYLGQIAELQQRWQDALQHYLRVNSGKDLIPALYNTTDLLMRGDQIEMARQRLSSARDNLPDERERLYVMEAEALARHEQLDTSLQVYREALVFFPDSIQLLYSRSLIFDQLDDIESAERDLRQLLSLDPDNVTALNALGYTLANRTDRYQEAYELIERAYQARPEDAAIIDSMGWVLYRLGKPLEALEYLQKAMDIIPDHEIAAHLGEVLWIVGRREEARQAWQKGLEDKPDSEIIQSTMRRLLNQ